MLCSFTKQVLAQLDSFGVSVLASGRLLKFGLRHWPSVLRDVVFIHKTGAGEDLLRYCCSGTLVFIADGEPICALQACMYADYIGVKVEGADQVLAQRDLLRNWTRTKAYKNDFQLLPKELDATVAKFRLPALGAVLTVFAQERIFGNALVDEFMAAFLLVFTGDC